MTFWSGYSRFVRHEGRAHKIWVPRGQCAPCDVTHALLPAFVALKRLDSIETIGAALETVTSGENGVRPAADRLGVVHTTVRGWLRSFGCRAASLALSFAALAVELGGPALAPLPDPRRDALAAMTAAWKAARLCRAGWPSPCGVSPRRCAAGRWWPPTRTRPISSSADVVSCLLSVDEKRQEMTTWMNATLKWSRCTAGR